MCNEMPIVFAEHFAFGFYFSFSSNSMKAESSTEVEEDHIILFLAFVSKYVYPSARSFFILALLLAR